MSERPGPDLSRLRSWTFLTNHAQVLLAIARDRDARVSDLAQAAEITERSTYRILADLQKAGYIERAREGRVNRYRIHRDLPLGDPLVASDVVADLVSLLRAEVEGHLVRHDRR